MNNLLTIPPPQLCKNTVDEALKEVTDMILG